MVMCGLLFTIMIQTTSSGCVAEAVLPPRPRVSVAARPPAVRRLRPLDARPGMPPMRRPDDLPLWTARP